MAEKAKAGTAHPAEGVGAPHKVFPPLDHNTFVPQLVWLAISFGLLYLLLSRIALPRIGEVIGERAERIKRDFDQAEKLKVETQQALANYEQALSEARGKANAIAKGMRDTLAAEIDKERSAVETQIAAKLADAEARIAATKSKALAGVNEIAAETAGAIVARLTGQDVSRDEVQKALAQPAAE